MSFTAADLLGEYLRREAPVRSMFEQQKTAVKSAARRKAYLTPRRAGKTWALIGDMYSDGLKHKGSHYRYIALTRGSAKDIAWPVAKDINRLFNVGATFNETELYVTLPGGSQIHLYGADRPGWMERLRGTKNRRCVIDEAQSYNIDLYSVIKSILGPSLMDERGTLILAGTPGPVRAGLFFHVTAQTGKHRGWDVHQWATKDNPMVNEQYLEELATITQDHPDMDILQIPWVKREYFGEWVEDPTNNVYRFDADKNSTFGPDWAHSPGDEYVCGIDLGWHDRTALVVGAYREDSPDFCVVESFSAPKMTLDPICERIKVIESKYPGVRFVGDPARRQLIEELQARADVFILAAEKQKKEDWIELVNRDLEAGRFKILNPESNPLAAEMSELKWVERPSGKVEESPAQLNDCCDAALYAYRCAYHYLHQPKAPKPEAGTIAHYESEADDMFRRAIAKQSKINDGDGDDSYWQQEEEARWWSSDG